MNPADDPRNLIDEFKGKTEEAIVAELDARSVMPIEIAIENVERDYNMGTIVRSANAFGVRTVHVIGRRQWNKRGAMATDKYLHVVYHASVEEFAPAMKQAGKTIIAVDNVPGARPLHAMNIPAASVLVFGSEGDGLSDGMIAMSDVGVAIEQFGSTRSVNVGVAAGILLYECVRRHILAGESS